MSEAKSTSYQTNGRGEHKWEVLTEKPFAEFKDEVNQAYENSWMRVMVGISWREKQVHFESWGADGDGVWGDGKVSAVLRVRSAPATWFERKIVYETGQMLQRACAYARTAEIEAENKESLRQSALETYREAYLNEVEAGILVGRWQAVDEVTRVLTALTSSGSAVSGWLVWGQPGFFKQTWTVLAAAASLLSITHVSLKVSDRVKDWSDTKGHFVRLRTELETMLYQMKVNPAFSLEEFAERFGALRTRFGEGEDRKKVDPLAIGIRQKVAPEVDDRCALLAGRTGRTVEAIS